MDTDPRLRNLRDAIDGCHALNLDELKYLMERVFVTCESLEERVMKLETYNKQLEEGARELLTSDHEV